MPIDSVTSVKSTLMTASVEINCVDQRHVVRFVQDRDLFSQRLNALVAGGKEQVYEEKPTMKVEKPVATQQSDYAELEQLKKLFDAGIITQEEFDAKKKQILGL